MPTELRAYHSDPALKAAMLEQVRAHEQADQIIKGSYGSTKDDAFRGCAVGCSLHSLALIKGRKLDTSNHMLFESEAGVPVMLARLQDTIFEGLQDGTSFPRRFWTAIRPGADLSRVGWQFLHWLLTEEAAGRDHPLVRDAIKQCADVLVPLKEGGPVDASAAMSAASAASAASAESAGSGSAESAAWSAAWSAESAAWSAARSAESAAWSAASAESAAWSAARSAASASAARSAAYQRMADKLIALMEAAT